MKSTFSASWYTNITYLIEKYQLILYNTLYKIYRSIIKYQLIFWWKRIFSSKDMFYTVPYSCRTLLEKGIRQLQNILLISPFI